MGLTEYLLLQRPQVGGFETGQQKRTRQPCHDVLKGLRKEPPSPTFCVAQRTASIYLGVGGSSFQTPS